MLEKIKKPHFIGVGGVGMSAIAHVLQKMGLQVSGSDAAQSSITEKLAAIGVKIYIGHDADNIAADCDAVVVSSAIKQENMELMRAKQMGIPVFHRSDLLAYLLNNRFGVAIAGAHGKTTTTSMLSCLTMHAGIDATYLIGGEVSALGGNAHLGKSDWLIAEADESDGSFLKFFPKIAIITNVENDHMDYYDSLASIESAFLRFASQTDQEGAVIVCFDDPVVKNMSSKIDRRIISYAIDEKANYQAKNIRRDECGSKYDLYYQDDFLTEINLAVPGKHNILNSLAVIAAARMLDVPIEKMQECLATFTGARRRFEKKGDCSGVLVVDDYAHHPSEIKSTLLAAKQVNRKRIVSIFQPHRYTRTKLLQEEFGKCFCDCDVLILTDVYSAGESPIEGIDGKTLLEQVKKQGRDDVLYIPDVDAVADYLLANAQQGDLVITLGAGDIYRAGEIFYQGLLAREELK